MSDLTTQGASPSEISEGEVTDLDNLNDQTLAEDYLIPETKAGIFRLPIRILTAIAAFFMFSITSVTITDVTGRYVFSSPIPGGVEIIEFLLGLTIFSSLALVTIKRAHITVELFEGIMSDGFKRFRDVIVLTANSCMVLFITHRMWATAINMMENDDISLHLEVPTAPLLFALCGLSALSAIVQMYMVWRFVKIDLRPVGDA